MSKNEVYQRIIEREKKARQEAEELLEQKSRELFYLNNELKELNNNLENKVHQRTLEIIKAKEAAEKANNIKTQFLSNISHELRTPLNQITGMTQILLNENVGININSRLKVIMDSAKTQLDMIERIIKVSEADRPENEKTQLYVSKSDLKATEFAFCSFKRKDNIQQNFYFDESIPDEMILRLKDIENFIKEALENAFKHTHSGMISLAIEINSEQKLEVSVTDTGEGIPESIRTVTNQLFTQADNSDRRSFGGLGLGFSIMHAAARNLKGEIRILSKAGIGSVVSLIIPINVKPLSQGLPKKKVQRILIVEDVDVNREIARAFLEQKGFEVITARNGLEAVEIYQTELSKIDLILMDCQMPVMDGFEATKRIHEIAKQSAPPIYAVTASARGSTHDHCLEVGMEDFFTKPVDWERLAEKIKAA